jgi:hypothetical protein
MAMDSWTLLRYVPNVDLATEDFLRTTDHPARRPVCFNKTSELQWSGLAPCHSTHFFVSLQFVHSGYGAEWGQSDVNGVPYNERIWSHQAPLFSGSWPSAEGVRVQDYTVRRQGILCQSFCLSFSTFHEASAPKFLTRVLPLLVQISTSLWGVSGSNMTRIGVLAHEMTHTFGLPDLYDTNSIANGIGAGLGGYCLMSQPVCAKTSLQYPRFLAHCLMRVSSIYVSHETF